MLFVYYVKGVVGGYVKDVLVLNWVFEMLKVFFMVLF